MTTLMPRIGGRYLNPKDVITRMQAEFAYVETVEEGARDHVHVWMDQLAFVAEKGRTAEVAEYMVQLERYQDAARFIHFTDDLGSDGVLLSMLMIPHQPLIIEAHDQREATLALIYRCAAALDYEVFVPASVKQGAAAGSEYPAALCRRRVTAEGGRRKAEREWGKGHGGRRKAEAICR
jgi:hypothetical protein